MIKVHGEGIEIPLTSNHKKSFLHPEISRQFSCPNDCGKAYRNTNGLSYHLKKSRCSKVRMQDSSLQEFLKRNIPSSLMDEETQPDKKPKTFANIEDDNLLKSVPF